MYTIINLLRCSHWIKNILIFIPLILSKQEISYETLTLFLLITICFCLIASANYVINDIFDLSKDKHHRLKRERAIASGKISIKNASLIAGSLIASSIYFNFLFDLNCFYYLLSYLLFAQIYSLYLKNIAMIDIICVTLFYVFRIFVGMMFVKTGFSLWLLSFSFFFFIGLASAKRIIELRLSDSDSFKSYVKNDTTFLINFGISSTFSSIIILLLYINSDRINFQYNNILFFYPIMLCVTCWLFQFWFSIYKANINVDLITYVIKSKLTYFYIFFITLFLFLA